jgi:phosphosulfolactate synthase
VVRHPFESIGFPALPPRPRKAGITSVIDKGAGPNEVNDVIAVAGQWIDVVKLGWGSARLTSPDALRDKLRHYREAGIRVCTGGTLCEIARAQGKVEPFLKAATDLGIDLIEVSNDVHPMTEDETLGLIEQVRRAGFAVWSEVGKKNPAEDAGLRIDERIAACRRELDAGAEKVILEGRESGTVGIDDRRGEPEEEMLDRLASDVGLANLVFEAPHKAQQVWLIRHFGPQVNLGDVPLAEALSLATLRTGLRSDTFADVHTAAAPLDREGPS